MPKALKFSPKSLPVIAEALALELGEIDNAYRSMVEDHQEIYAVIDLPATYAMPVLILTEETVRRDFLFLAREQDDIFNEVVFKL
jgi:hypothetical protein